MDSEEATRGHFNHAVVATGTADRIPGERDFQVGQRTLWRGSRFLTAFSVQSSARIGNNRLARRNAAMFCLRTSWLVCRPPGTMYGPSGGEKTSKRVLGSIFPRNSHRR